MSRYQTVSIIIPTFNRCQLLQEAIKSVLNQTYHNFELIVVDDYSQDGTLDVVKNFNDARVVYLRQKENGGISVACNAGIKKAKGEFIFILNDDDLLAPFALEELVKKINGSDLSKVGGVYGWSWWVDNNGRTSRIIDSRVRGYIFRKILRKHIFTNVLVKKLVFSEVGFYKENLRKNEDLDFYLRLAKNYQLDFIPEILTIIRGHKKEHLSSFSKNNILSANNVLKNYDCNFGIGRNILAIISPSRLYVSLSIFKNLLFAIIKMLLNHKLASQITFIKSIFKKQGIKV